MIFTVLAAAFAALAGPCDLERPSGAPGCTRAAVDQLRINQVQVLGSHNSYKQAIAPAEFRLIAAVAPQVAQTLDYGHPPLQEQLGAGARTLEIDVLLDPEGGRSADPLALRTAGAATLPYDFAPLRGPGLKVMHVQDLDYRAHCNVFTTCLRIIRDWSRAHRGHLPLLILINLKEGPVGAPNTVDAPAWDAAGLALIDQEIRSVFSRGEMIVPDQVRGRRATLREAVAAGGWPTLKSARGKVLFALDTGRANVDRYLGESHALQGKVMFVNIAETEPAAGYITLNDPIGQADRIRAAVAAGILVRTRSDADTAEARSGDTRRREAAFASGAQFISSDYMRPDPRFTTYSVSLPGGGAGRLNPLLAPSAH